MTLEERLGRRRAELRGGLEPGDRETLRAAVERLRMLQLVEQGLQDGDLLPEFALPGTDGMIVSGEALLAEGPLAVVFVRGPWCPYCSLALEALEEVRPALERLGAGLVVISPMGADDLRRAADERGLRLQLVSDAGAGYARICGVQYEMTQAHIDLYRRLGWDIERFNAGSGWELPVPASYVAGRDGVIGFAFADADWSHRAEPAAMVAAVERLAYPRARRRTVVPQQRSPGRRDLGRRA
jgi:peroxiredoxin